MQPPRCDKCDKPAVVHETTIKNGVKTEIHLCPDHAADAGFVVHQAPINQLLKQFVISQSGSGQKGSGKTCPECGLTYAQFRRTGTLGCPNCYDTFVTELGPLIERAQNGGTHHIGKRPQRAGRSIDRQLEMRRLMRELDIAIAAEQYEKAAEIRDRLNNLEPGAEGESQPSSDPGAGIRSGSGKPGSSRSARDKDAST